MTIDHAIKLLQSEKAAGVKNVIAVWWDAGQFGRIDDAVWADAAERVERKMDWSDTYENISELIELYTGPTGE